MPATKEMIDEARTEVRTLLDVCDIYLSPENEKRGLDEPITRLRNLYGRLDLDGLDNLPADLVKNIGHNAGVFNIHLHRAFGTWISPSGDRMRIIHVHKEAEGEINRHYDEAFNDIILASSGFFPEVIDNLKKNAKEEMAQAVKKIEQDAGLAVEEIKKAGQEANAIIETAREAAAAVGVSQHATIFQEEANKCRKTAIGWLVMAVIALAVFAWAGDELFSELSAIDNVWSFIITRSVLLSTIVYALFFFVKNYRANRHNYVVNKHRQNALQTYQVLVASATSPEVQDIVLTHAARCIFDQRDTGYAKGGGNEGGNVVNVETARKVVKLADGDGL